MSILEEIVAYKRKDVKRRERQHSIASFFDFLEKSRCLPLKKLFPKGTVNIIGELKRRSPFGGELVRDYEPVALARQLEPYCRALSVLTDEHFFGGTLDDLMFVASAVSVPVLCKDFVVHPYQVYEARLYGADSILFIARVLPEEQLRICIKIARHWRMHPLVEVFDERDIGKALSADADFIDITNRDLATGAIDLRRTEALAPLIPPHIYTISASGITAYQDIERLREYVDGFLIGSSILKAGSATDAFAALSLSEKF